MDSYAATWGIKQASIGHNIPVTGTDQAKLAMVFIHKKGCVPSLVLILSVVVE